MHFFVFNMYFTITQESNYLSLTIFSVLLIKGVTKEGYNRSCK